MASLVEAIQQAEDLSTGEIRLHIDKSTEENNAKVAFDVFKNLGMDNTKERNAVLFHVNFEKNTLPSLVIKAFTKKFIKNFGTIYTTKSHTLFPKENISRFA
jgi:hypothetical protein